MSDLPSSPVTAEPPSPRARSATLWSPALTRIVLAQALFGFGWCLYLVQPKFLTQELGVGPAEVGTTMAFGGASGVVAIFGVLALIDRRGGRRLLFLIGSLLLCAASVAYLFVDRFGPLVYVIQIGLNAAYVLAFNAAMALVTDVAPKERIGHAFGLQSAANLSMNAISSLVAESVSERYGWRAVFALAVLASLVCFLFGLSLPSAPRTAAENAPASLPPVRAPYLRVLPILLASGLLGAAFIAMFAFHQPYALELGAERVGAFFIGFTAAALGMRLGLGGLGDRFGHARVSIGAAVLYAAVPFAMSGLSPALLWVYGAALGIAHGVAYPTLTALATSRVPPRAHGRIIAAFSGSFHAGSTLGAFAWGQVAAAGGYPRVFFGATAACVVALAVLAAARLTPRTAI
ncbi:MAG TPA: MFS transporter [Polyangiaceae bacterium]|nr:MFS transporter [Polyangiaceae bacterium]